MNIASDATQDTPSEKLETESDHDDAEYEERDISDFETKVLDIVQKISIAENDVDIDAAKTEFLSNTADTIDVSRHACMLLHFARMFAGEGERDGDIWEWAQAFRAKFSEPAGVLSLFAALGNVIRSGPAEAMSESIDVSDLEKLFRLSLSLDPDSVGSHLLAGEYFLFNEQHGEAERCLARAFRLDRSNESAAMRLSEVYQQTDRPRDALNVLDLCLREGCDAPNVAWEALVQAVHAQQFEAALTYADRFDALEPNESGVNYYRATALVELGRHSESLAAVAAEMKFEPDETLHLDAVRACAWLGIGEAEKAGKQFDDILNRPFGPVTFLTTHGLNQILEMIWRQTNSLGENDPIREQLRQRMLTTGLMPDSYFDKKRESGDEQTVNFYQVLIEQPLEEDWGLSPGCLPGQDHWMSYRAVWGVLAENETRARDLVFEWQNRCDKQTPSIEEVALDGEGYKDRAGVVWQGMRWCDGDE